MKILVCVKQVPDTNEVKIDPVKGTLIRDGVPSILNPDDANALEAALQLKDKNPDVKVAVLTMGPPQATYMLRECLAMGADEAYLLSDRAFGGADTCATSTTIAAGISKVEGVDVIFAGRQAIDGDTAQVGPQVAQRLGLPVVTYVQDIDMGDGKVRVHRQMEDGYEVIEVNTHLRKGTERTQIYVGWGNCGRLQKGYPNLGPQRCRVGSPGLRPECFPHPGIPFLYPSPEGKGRDALRNRRRYGRNAGGKISGKAFSLTGCRKRPEYIRWVPAACIALKRQKYSL